MYLGKEGIIINPYTVYTILLGVKVANLLPINISGHTCVPGIGILIIPIAESNKLPVQSLFFVNETTRATLICTVILMCKSYVVPGSYGQHVVASLSEGDRQTTYYIPKASSLGPGSDFSRDKDNAQGVSSFSCFFSERRCLASHNSMLRCTLSQGMDVSLRFGT